MALRPGQSPIPSARAHAGARGGLRLGLPRARIAQRHTSLERERAMSLGLQTVGRSKKAVFAIFDHELTPEEIQGGLCERGTKPPEIKQLRERHHFLARLIAEGKRPGEAAVLARFDNARVSVLLSDPAFKDLVAHYQAMVNEEFVDFQRKLAELSVDAAHILQERLEDTPEEITTGQLMNLITIGADRTGHGPSQKTELNVKIGLADRLAQARERIAVAKDITPPEAAE